MVKKSGMWIIEKKWLKRTAFKVGTEKENENVRIQRI